MLQHHIFYAFSRSAHYYPRGVKSLLYAHTIRFCSRTNSAFVQTAHFPSICVYVWVCASSEHRKGQHGRIHTIGTNNRSWRNSKCTAVRGNSNEKGSSTFCSKDLHLYSSNSYLNTVTNLDESCSLRMRHPVYIYCGTKTVQLCLTVMQGEQACSRRMWKLAQVFSCDGKRREKLLLLEKYHIYHDTCVLSQMSSHQTILIC